MVTRYGYWQSEQDGGYKQPTSSCLCRLAGLSLTDMVGSSDILRELVKELLLLCIEEFDRLDDSNKLYLWLTSAQFSAAEHLSICLHWVVAS